MLSSALRRNVCKCTLKNLKKCLLNTLTAYVTGDGGVFAFSCNLIYFVNVDNTALCLFNIKVSRLNKS